jgi:predicted neuraminidase
MGIPGIERTAAGRLFVTFFSGGKKEPSPHNRIYLTQSDGGKQFAQPTVIIDPPGETRAYDPALWIDPDGRLWLFHNLSNERTNTHDVWAITCDRPDGDEPRWSDPRRIGFDVAFAFRLNKPTVTQHGAWLLPVTWHDEKIDKGWHTGRELQGVAISTDRGNNWSLHGEVHAPPWAIENMIVERSDGELLMYIRTGDGVIWQSHSTDGGHHWANGERTNITNAGSRFFFRKLQSGRWLLINSPRPDSRTSLVAQLSEDEGKTWSDPLVIDDRDNVSYPDAVETPDGGIVIVHDRERETVGEVILSRFAESDLLDG